MIKGKIYRSGSIACAVVMMTVLGAPAALAQTETQTEAPQTKTLQERLDERKAQLKTRLTNAQQIRLKTRCKAAQALLGTHRDKVKAAGTPRINAYNNIIDRLNKLVTKVGDKADTSVLQAQIAALKEKVEALKTNASSYDQIISDLVEMDCASDPTAFRATLESAKSLRVQHREQAAAIRAYINDTIKPTLAALRVQLQSKTEGAN